MVSTSRPAGLASHIDCVHDFVFSIFIPLPFRSFPYSPKILPPFHFMASIAIMDGEDGVLRQVRGVRRLGGLLGTRTEEASVTWRHVVISIHLNRVFSVRY